MRGADTAFDDWTLIRYSASRICTIRILLTAKTFASKFASLFQVRTFAPVAA